MSSKHLFLLFFYLFLCRFVDAEIGQNGICSLLGVIPFTNDGRDHLGSATNNNNIGYSHLAAVRLAMRQFNTRNAEVVPELQSDLIEGCNVSLNNFINIDSQYGGHAAATEIIKFLRDNDNEITTINDPCAVVGPKTDVPISEVSVVAQSLAIPLVAYGGSDERFVNPNFHPLTSRTSSDSESLAEAMTDYLVKVHKRTDYIVILYPLTDIGIQLREFIAVSFTRKNVTWISVGYPSISWGSESAAQGSMEEAARQIKESGYRTVLFVFESDQLDDLQSLGVAAEKYDINNGDYFWLMYGFGKPVNLDDFYQLNGTTTKLLRGAAAVQAVENFVVNPDSDPFLKSWRSQGKDLVDEVNFVYPVKNVTDPGYYFGLPDYFNTTDPEIGAGFLFDAVMSIGFGACIARNESEPVTSSLDHLNGIRESDFQGSTGKVNFKDTSSTPGSRRSSGLTFGGYNLGVVDDETQEL